MRISRPSARLGMATALVLALALPVTAGTARADGAAGQGVKGLGAVRCTDHVLNVRIADPGPADQKIWGRLCIGEGRRPTAVQLLVPGGTYSHVYWDLPYGGGRYSYAREAAAAGYATFNVDRVGIGHSSHPPGAQLTVTAGAIALHDVITALRAGRVGGYAFSHVIWVGHSVGSFTAWDEAARYQDVDAMILTGAMHAFNLQAALQGQAALYTATDDPRFADSGLDADYMTTKPGTREGFYSPDTTDPHVVALDEANKATMTTGELAGPSATPPYRINVPVLLLVGGNDALFCVGVTQYSCSDPKSVLAFESQFYPPAAHPQVVVIPGAGHSVALSTVAPLATAAMIRWTRSVIAQPGR